MLDTCWKEGGRRQRRQSCSIARTLAQEGESDKVNFLAILQIIFLILTYSYRDLIDI
jgi:hypothetical protein